MNSRDLLDIRSELKLSRAKFCKLITDPVTKQQLKPDTLYRWERELPEVKDLPAWLERAFVAFKDKMIRQGYLPKPIPTRGRAIKEGNRYKYWEDLDANGKPIWKYV